MLSVVIPMSDMQEFTDECIENLVNYANGFLDIIVIDNGSEIPYKNNNVRVIRNERNVGFWPSMLQGIAIASNNIVVCQHNDVFVWEHGWDERIEREFASDPLLGMIGYFGGRGVSLDGGRGHPESNMLGKKHGTPGHLHGHEQTHKHPAVVFDSLAMIFDRNKLYTIDYESIPMHHWTDRLVCLRMIKKGYHLLTLGIEFDHGGGYTSTRKGNNNPVMEEWCKKMNLPFETSWDMTLYHYGREMFEKELSEVLGNGFTQLWVSQDYRYGKR